MDQVFDDALAQRLGMGYGGLAPIDLYQTDDEVVVEAIMPGMKSEDIAISITGDTVTVEGQVRESKDVTSSESEAEAGIQYIVRECRFERLSRTIKLPTLVDADKAEANYEDGILKLRMPKVEAMKPKTISVKTK
jgi:HSP20 family protein